MFLLLALADLGALLLARARAQTAADAAALAAAAELVPGSDGAPRDAARQYASHNGASLVACDCSANAQSVEVSVKVPVRTAVLRFAGEVGARARAEVDLTALFSLKVSG